MLRRRAAQQEQALDDVLGTNDRADDAALPENNDIDDYDKDDSDREAYDSEDYDSEDYDSEDYDSEDYDSERRKLSADHDDAEEDVYTTRLKLAEAYIEMGDEDGAEGMLEEVIADGSPEQQEIARRILARLEAQRNPGRPENGDN